MAADEHVKISKEEYERMAAEQYEKGWNDFIGTIILFPQRRDKYIDRYTTLTGLEGLYAIGAKAAAEAVKQNKPVEYRGPQSVIDDMNEKAPISQLYSD